MQAINIKIIRPYTYSYIQSYNAPVLNIESMHENKALKKHNFKMTTAYKATKGGQRGSGGGTIFVSLLVVRKVTNCAQVTSVHSSLKIDGHFWPRSSSQRVSRQCWAQNYRTKCTVTEPLSFYDGTLLMPNTVGDDVDSRRAVGNRRLFETTRDCSRQKLRRP